MLSFFVKTKQLQYCCQGSILTSRLAIGFVFLCIAGIKLSAYII